MIDRVQMLLPDGVPQAALAQLRRGLFPAGVGVEQWLKAYREASLAPLRDACVVLASAIDRRGSWDVVIVPEDGDPESWVWGCGPTMRGALDEAVDSLHKNFNEWDLGAPLRVIAYRDAAWMDVRNKAWDTEIVIYGEKVDISIMVGDGSYQVVEDKPFVTDRRGATEPASAPRCRRCGVALGYHADDLASICADCAATDRED